MKKKNLMLVLLILLVSFPVLAQSEEPTSTFGISPTDIVMLFSVAVLIWNALVTRNISHLYKDIIIRKDVRDSVEQRYLQSSISIQDAIILIKSIVTTVDSVDIPLIDEYMQDTKKFLDEVTDGKENT